MPHDQAHGEERCPLCPTDNQLAGMRERNRRTAQTRREAMLAAIAANPSAYVFAVEARDDIDADIIMQISSTLEKAREYCLAQTIYENHTGVRFHVIAHLVDTPDGDTTTGVISLAVYGIRSGETKVEDLVGTDDE